MSQIEINYEGFLSSIRQIVPNMDADLMVKIMYLERKLPDVSPRVELHVEYKTGVDMVKKQEQIRAKYGFPMQVGVHGITMIGQMNIDLIEEISKDQDIEHISGVATPASY